MSSCGLPVACAAAGGGRVRLNVAGGVGGASVPCPATVRCQGGKCPGTGFDQVPWFKITSTTRACTQKTKQTPGPKPGSGAISNRASGTLTDWG